MVLVLPRSKVADGLAGRKLIRSVRDATSRRLSSDSLKVTDDRGLGPVGTVSGTAAEEGAVASVARLDEVDVGIGNDPLAGFSKETDERIVLGAENERGNDNAVDDAGAGGAVVVVVGIAGSRNRGRRSSGRTRGWSARDRCRGLDRCRERARLCGGSAA